MGQGAQQHGFADTREVPRLHVEEVGALNDHAREDSSPGHLPDIIGRFDAVDLNLPATLAAGHERHHATLERHRG